MSKHRALLERALVVFLGLGLTLLGLEVLLRAVGFAQRQAQASLRPEAGARLVLCVGDSYTACPGVARNDTYPAQLEQQLNAPSPLGAAVPGRPTRRFQVLNLGLNGQNSTSLRDELAGNLEKYRPDVVVLLTGGNNTWDLSGYRAFEQADSAGARGLDLLGRLRVFKLARLVYLGIQGKPYGQELEVSPPPAPPEKRSPRRRPAGTALAQAGARALKGMDYPTAETLFQAALARDRGDFFAWHGLALVYSETGRYPQGIQACLEALRLEPTATDCYCTLAQLYSRTGQRQQALDAYLAGLERGEDTPDQGEKVRLLGRFLRFADQGELARSSPRLQALAATRPPLRPFLSYAGAPASGQPRMEDWIVRDLEDILALCRAGNVPVVLMNYPRDHPRGISSLYRRVALRHSVRFVDNQDSFKALQVGEYFQGDGHLTARGNARLASNAREAVLEILGP